MEIEMFGRNIGERHPVFFIAEIGLNHNGSMEIAKKLIDVAVESGCDAVKFQKRHVKSLATKAFLDAPDTRFPEFGRTYREIREFVEFSEEQLKELKAYSHKRGIVFFITPFDIPSLELIDRVGVDAYKSASHNLTYLPLLKEIIRRGKPVIASTGMASLDEVDRAVAMFKESNIPFVLLQCVSSYPTAPELVNLRAITFMRDRYQVPIGYSGHERLDTHHLPTLAAVARGACIVERHITLDNNMMGFDHKISVNPHDLRRLVASVRMIEMMMGSGTKELLPNELEKREQQRVSIVSAKTIPFGTRITEDMLCYKGPGIGFATYEVDKILGRTATTDIPVDVLIEKTMIS